MLDWEYEKMMVARQVAEPLVVDALFNNYTIPEGEIYTCKNDFFSKYVKKLGRTIYEPTVRLDIPDKYHIISQVLGDGDIIFCLENFPRLHTACFLMKSTFIGGQKRFEDLFSVYPPKVILQFARRIKYNSGHSYNCAWFIWEKGWRGETTVRWISKFTSDY